MSSQTGGRTQRMAIRRGQLRQAALGSVGGTYINKKIGHFAEMWYNEYLSKLRQLVKLWW
jgi:hypothetical protein